MKRLSSGAVDGALEKMERYRLLNEPEDAESICRDILAVAPDHREARIGLLLCLTDQFDEELSRHWSQACEVLETLAEGYDRRYYRGIMCERRAKAHHHRGGPQAGAMAHGWLLQAMECFERAAEKAPPGNESARLRWNTCVRMIEKHDDIRPSMTGADTGPELLE